jgi:cytoskeletal protein CcmA (bactofilin family)
MFDKKPKAYTDLLGKTNRIVEKTIIKGDIQSPADFRFDGYLTGNILSEGKLVIGPASQVIGDIQCKNCDIEGEYEGTIIVEELLSIKATAKVKGKVSCSKLLVEPGAVFNAICIMKSPASAASSTDGIKTS